MAVTNRGSILISTANDIGSSLVDVIGGEGYTPNEWSKKINLCGIAAADVPTALENIEESTPSGTDRGSISLDTANAVGAVLNKKFNTARGFKPSEWASAISFLEPLPERTASGGVANIQDGADKVPVKSWLVTLPASLDGYTAIHGAQTGKNLFDKSAVEIDKYLDTTTGLPVPAVNYVVSDYIPVFSGVTIYIPASQTARRWFYDKNKIPTTYLNTSGNQSYTPSTDGYIRVSILKTQIDIDTYQIEYGSATAYEAYNGTQYTASLGRTIYGGEVDIVNGTAKPTNLLPNNATSQTIRYCDFTVNADGSVTADGTVSGGGAVFTLAENIPIKAGNYVLSGCASGGGGTTWELQAHIGETYYREYGIGKTFTVSEDTTISFAIVVRNNATISNETFYPMLEVGSTPSTYSPYFTPFTFTPITAETALGVNNFWANEGDSSVVYRADIDSPEPSNLLGLSNSNDNIEEEGNI